MKGVILHEVFTHIHLSVFNWKMFHKFKNNLKQLLMQTEQREYRRNLGIISCEAFRRTNYPLADSI